MPDTNYSHYNSYKSLIIFLQEKYNSLENEWPLPLFAPILILLTILNFKNKKKLELRWLYQYNLGRKIRNKNKK